MIMIMKVKIIKSSGWLVGWSNCFTLKSNLSQEAIKQLRERGEKVTAFVVIAVAKQVGGRFAK